MREKYLLDIIEQDKLFADLEDSIIMKGGVRAAAMATDLFANFVLDIETRFSERSDKQIIKDDVKKGIIETISSIRNNVKMLEFLELENDIATIEFVIFASYLIHREFVKRGFDDMFAFEIIRMALFDIFKQDTHRYLPVIEMLCLEAETLRDAMLVFLLRLYYTNKMGRNTIPIDFNSQTMDVELLKEFASNLTTFATKKGIEDKIIPYTTLEKSIVNCMTELGISQIIDQEVINEAYSCVEKLCNK